MFLQKHIKIKRRSFFKKSGIFISGGIFTSVAGSAVTVSTDSLNKISSSGKSDMERIQTLLSRKEPNIWLFTGDSITHGAKHTHGYRSYPEVFQERIRWEMGRMRDIVINTGISGNATKNILDDFDWRIAQFSPNMVSVMIGTNDCARNNMNTGLFRKNVRELVTRIRSIEAIPVLHTPNIIILDKSPERKTFPDYVPVLRELVTEENVVLVDNYLYWQRATQDKTAEFIFKNWLNDPLHPNQTGHQEIARLMFKKLKIFDPGAPTCGSEYYKR